MRINDVIRFEKAKAQILRTPDERFSAVRLLGRLRYDDVPSRYTPQGGLGSLSWFGAIGVTMIVVVLSVWIRWSARHLHAADITEAEAIPDDEIETRWNELPEVERHVVVLYHYESLYLKEIGGILGVTESRVSQILARATQRLQLKLEEKG